ncbi:MAG: hypothetical protein ABIL20_05320 [candidate division WOR-3 bacterium]
MGSLVGEMFLKSGLISEDQLKKALDLQKEKHKRLGEILIELGYISLNDLVWILSEQASIPFIEIRPEMLDSNLINSFPERLLYDNCLLPLYEDDDKIFVAIGDPTNKASIDQLRKHTKKEIVVSGADPKRINQLLDKLYLAEQTEDIISLVQSKEIITIEIADGQATVHITEQDGKTILKKARAHVTIKLENLEESKEE